MKGLLIIFCEHYIDSLSLPNFHTFLVTNEHLRSHIEATIFEVTITFHSCPILFVDQLENRPIIMELGEILVAIMMLIYVHV